MEQPGKTSENPDDRDSELDPAVEAKVRSLLAAAPTPGPMPEAVAQRIESALNDEVALRVDPPPPTSPPAAPLTPLDQDQVVLAPLIRQRQRPRPLFAVAAVAAAAAVVAVGGSALHLSKRADGTANLGNPSAVIAPPGPPSVTPSVPPSDSTSQSPSHSTAPIPPPVGPTNANLHIQLSSTDYRSITLAAQTRQMVTNPDIPLQVLAAEAPTLGPIATEVGLESCLGALGLPTDVPIHVDLATYEGAPAAVIAVTRGGETTVRVVDRTCQAGGAGLLADAILVP